MKSLSNKKAERAFGRFLVKFDAKSVSAGTAQNYSPLGSEILIKKLLQILFVWSEWVKDIKKYPTYHFSSISLA